MCCAPSFRFTTARIFLNLTPEPTNRAPLHAQTQDDRCCCLYATRERQSIILINLKETMDLAGRCFVYATMRLRPSRSPPPQTPQPTESASKDRYTLCRQASCLRDSDVCCRTGDARKRACLAGFYFVIARHRRRTLKTPSPLEAAESVAPVFCVVRTTTCPRKKQPRTGQAPTQLKQRWKPPGRKITGKPPLSGGMPTFGNAVGRPHAKRYPSVGPEGDALPKAENCHRPRTQRGLLYGIIH